MNQCLHVTFFLDGPKEILPVIQKKARELCIEGTLCVGNGQENHVKVVLCGSPDSIENFLDLLHAEVAKNTITELEIEPFIKEKDFRGVFRIIE